MTDSARFVTDHLLRRRFYEVVLPHLDAGYRLPRWLMRNEHDAEDAVQEASLRAFRYFGTFVGGDARAWFLKIVRNICTGWRARRFKRMNDPFDEQQHRGHGPAANPETLLLQTDDTILITRDAQPATSVSSPKLKPLRQSALNNIDEEEAGAVLV